MYKKSVFLWILFLLLWVPLAIVQAAPLVNTSSQLQVPIDAGFNLPISGIGFGDTPGDIININTNQKLNVSSPVVTLSWADTSISILYDTYIAPPNVLQLGQNTFKIRTSSGLESPPFTIMGQRRGQATITSVTPTTVHANDEVVITGSGFGTNGIDGKVGTMTDYLTTFYPHHNLSWTDTEIHIKLDGLPSSSFIGNTNIIVAARLPDTRLYSSNFFPITVSKPICSSWTYSDWATCQSNATQTRTILNSSPDSCVGGNPVLTQSCTYVPPALSVPKINSINPSSIYYNGNVDIIGTGFGDKTVSNGGTADGSTITIKESPGQGEYIISWSDTDVRVSVNNSNIFGTISLIVGSVPQGGNRLYSNAFPITLLGDCRGDEWHCGDYGQCQSNGTKTRSCTKTLSCPNVPIPSPETVLQCTYTPPACSADTYSCGDWNACSVSGLQTRTCNKTFDCPTTNTPSPSILQSCTPPLKPISPITPPVYQPLQPPQPSCDVDTWTCGDWNSCSISGVQNRSCRKTFDCPSVETAPPVTDQYCEAPNRPTQQVPQDSSEISNQDTIIKATVKLMCLFDENSGTQGSGTVIDPSGIILTNKHVVAGTLGCFVGFISNSDDAPYFGDRQIADIQKTSSNEDVVVLKLRNPQNRKLTYIDITKANSNFRLGTKVNLYGYPAIFGKNLTYTSGDYSGTDGSYLKTTAIIEHGNSGGGAYLNNGMFVGIPSGVIRGELNALGYILSVNVINAWLGNSSIAYNGNSNQNNYSRVSSVLENIDLKKLNSLELIVPGTKKSKEITNKTTQGSPTIPPSIIKKTTPSQIQKEVPKVIKKIVPKEIKKVEQKEKVAPPVSPTPVKKLKWYQKIFN